jgi:membrane protease YdiL (CAAX protease family)
VTSPLRRSGRDYPHIWALSRPERGRPGGVWVIYAVLVYVVAFTLPIVVASVMLSVRGAPPGSDAAEEIALASSPVIGVVLGVGTFWAVRRLRLAPIDIGWALPRGCQFGRDVLLGVAVVVGFYIAGTMYAAVLKLFGLDLPDLLADFRPALRSPWLQVLLAVSSIAIAPLGEELFYRGLVLTMAAQKLRPWFAAVVVSVIFAISHLTNPQAWVLLTILAAGLSAVRLYTGGLTASITAHALNNLVSILVLFDVVTLPEL